MIKDTAMDGQVVWVLIRAGEQVANEWLLGLASRGCRMMYFSDVRALRHAMERQAVLQPAALVLMADVASNCQAAHTARQAWSDLSLVAWHGQQVGPEQAALLSAGVDYVLRSDDPPALLASVLLALDYRRARHGATVRPGLFVDAGPAGADARIGPWRLADKGWVLGHGNAMLRLTVSERAILLCLFDAPGHVASHADLIGAVRQVWQPRQQARIRDPRCRGIISRLRLRAVEAGMPAPPVDSLRDFGYAWTL